MAVFLRVDRGNAFLKSVSLSLNPGLLAEISDISKYTHVIKSLDNSYLFDKDGEEIKEGVAKAGQRVTLKLGEIKADKYHVQLVPNPELLKAGYLGGAQLIEPYEGLSLEYLFKAEKQIDFASLSYLFRVYIID